MNKTFEEIKEYVQSGAENVTDYIKEKAGQLKEDITEAGTKLSKVAKKTAIATVLGATLVTSTAACGTEGEFNLGEMIENIIPGQGMNANVILYPIPEDVKTVEELEESGEEITAQHVLDALDYYCYLKTKIDCKGSISENQYDYVSAGFDSIYTHTLFYRDENEKPVIKDAPFYNIRSGDIISVNIHYNQGVGEYSEPTFTSLNLKDFHKVLDYLNIEKFEITEEYLNNINLLNDLRFMLGSQVYQPIRIDREMISKINDKEILYYFLTFTQELINQCYNKLNIESITIEK